MKPWFALLGLFLGHQFDRGFEARYRAAEDQLAGSGRLHEAYLRALFEVMGHLAKTDGRVSEDEIRAARRVMHRLGLKPAQVRQAISAFDDGKRPEYPLEDRLAFVAKRHARRNDLRLLFIRLLLEVSVSKPHVHRAERDKLWQVCQQFGIGRVELAQLEAMIRAQQGFRRSPAGAADSERVQRAYAALGVAADANNDEIKRAYRRQMSKHHPDKLASAKPDSAALAEAERKTKEIRGAYEMLKARRSIR